MLLVHEWPRGIVSRAAASARGCHRDLKAYRFPWIGNPVTRAVVDRIRPAWVLCGHSHTAFASVIEHEGGGATYVACLDQAARPEGAVFWIEWEQGRAVRAGWGITGREAWKVGERWDECRTPRAGWAERHPRWPRAPRGRAGEGAAAGERRAKSEDAGGATSARARSHE
jgi:hypothetical protein